MVDIREGKKVLGPPGGGKKFEPLLRVGQKVFFSFQATKGREKNLPPVKEQRRFRTLFLHIYSCLITFAEEVWLFILFTHI